MSDARLQDLFVSHTGHISDKWEHYLGIYESELTPIINRGAPISLLEIGVQNGGSLQIWEKYLPPGSDVFGIDVDPNCARLDLGPSITVAIADATSDEQLGAALGHRTFDAIIDDGSHLCSDVIQTFQLLFERLRPGGKYLIEDLHCSYWRSHGGGLRDPGASIEWIKGLVDSLNADHFVVEGSGAVPAWTQTINRHVARITFYDSVAVVEKFRKPKHAPYRRLLSGETTVVEDPARWFATWPTAGVATILTGPTTARHIERRILDEIALLRDERENHQAELAGRDEQIATFHKAMAERDAKIARLSKAVAGRDAQLDALRASSSWRITKPLRAFGILVHLATQRCAVLYPYLLDLARRVYRSLPLSPGGRLRIPMALAHYTPGIARLLVPPPSVPPVPVPTSLKYKMPLAFHCPDAPDVSIIIPVCGKLEYTIRCLRSIANYPSRHSFEIIVVEDCPPDTTPQDLGEILGVRLIINTSNVGFLRSRNLGAAHARGQYLVFLHNDTEVTADWLDELVGTFSVMPDAGLVGGMLLYPDGSLREAGGIVWNDGSTCNYGRNDDPRKPQYNYLRQVDYCSAAAIAIPKELFLSVGAFDERYILAHAQATDLAFKVREAGRKVCFQPLSRVVHFEGIPSGTDTTHGVKAFQDVSLFTEKWRDTLVNQRPPGDNFPSAVDRGVTNRVLVIDRYTPTPDQNAGSIVILNVMRTFRALGFKVTFIPEGHFLFVDRYTSDLQRLGVEALYAPYHRSVKEHLQENGLVYDAVFIHRVGVAIRHLDDIKRYCSQAKIIFLVADLHHLREEREAELKGLPELAARAKETKAQELAVMRRSHCVLVHSSVEKERLGREEDMPSVTVLPWITETPGTATGFQSRADIGFVGGYQHRPNVDAVLYFVQDVFPLIRIQTPGVRFYVIGSKPPAEIQALAGPDIVVTGYVRDLNPLMDRLRVFVAPLRYGAGIKGKIGTAMSYGVPTVGTTIAAEGMGLEHEHNILVADDAEEFADAVVRLYQDQSLWERLSTKSVEFARQMYSFDRSLNILAEAFRAMELNIRDCNNGAQLPQTRSRETVVSTGKAQMLKSACATAKQISTHG